MQLHTSTCLQEIITRQHTQMDWFLEHMHYKNDAEGGPFKQYGERLMNNAREHGLLTEQKTRTPEAEYKALKDAGIKLLSIFEKPVQLRTAQDKKIFARNRVDFDAIIHKHLLEKGEKQYTKNQSNSRQKLHKYALPIPPLALSMVNKRKGRYAII